MSENSPVESFPRDRLFRRKANPVGCVRTTNTLRTYLHWHLPTGWYFYFSSRRKGFEGAVSENSPVESFPRDRLFRRKANPVVCVRTTNTLRTYLHWHLPTRCSLYFCSEKEDSKGWLCPQAGRIPLDMNSTIC